MSSDLLNIGSSGLNAYRGALSTVSENVTNANSEGYTRRRIVLTESPVSSGTSILYRPQVTFGGVNIGSITRSWDQFKSADARRAGTEAGEASAKYSWMTNLETALNDGDSGIGTRLTQVFTKADELSADPNGDFPRRAFLNAIDETASAFRQTASDLARLADNIETQATAKADLINADLTTLGRLNVQLRKAGVGTSTYAQASDERDRILDEVAGLVNIDVTYDDYGGVTVTLANDPSKVLVKDATAALVGVQRAPDGQLGFLLSSAAIGSTIFTPSGGELAGLQSAAEQLAGRRTQLDGIATDFATALNDWSAAGLDVNNNAGQPMLDVTGGAIALTALITDPDLVPAANATDGAFGNLATLSATVRTASAAEDRWTALVASHAQVVSSSKTNVDVTSARKDIAFSARDAVSGVDLDQEAADLLRFQQAYSACAHIIQVARDTLDEILNLF